MPRQRVVSVIGPAASVSQVGPQISHLSNFPANTADVMFDEAATSAQGEKFFKKVLSSKADHFINSEACYQARNLIISSFVFASVTATAIWMFRPCKS